LEQIQEGAKYYKAWANNEISYEEMSRLDASLWKGIHKSEMIKVLEIKSYTKRCFEI
jgi:alkylhydroperoxidase family enzyme